MGWYITPLLLVRMHKMELEYLKTGPGVSPPFLFCLDLRAADPFPVVCSFTPSSLPPMAHSPLGCSCAPPIFFEGRTKRGGGHDAERSGSALSTNQQVRLDIAQPRSHVGCLMRAFLEVMLAKVGVIWAGRKL